MPPRISIQGKVCNMDPLNHLKKIVTIFQNTIHYIDIQKVVFHVII